MDEQKLQQKYGQLCMELGHLVSNAKKVNARIAQLELEIDQVDRAVAALKQEVPKDGAPKSEEAKA